MVTNRAVVYVEPGKVEVRDIGYPELVLRDGPGVNPLNVGSKM
jgi:glutathione-independent formaldehyde dehydrogenase